MPSGLPLNGAKSSRFPARRLKHIRVRVDSEVRRTGPGLTTVWHSHDAIEFNLVIAGRGILFLDRAEYELSPGVLVWLLPNQSHRLMPGPDLTMWVFSCPSDRCERDLLDDVARHACRVLAREDAITLDRLFAHISQDADEPRLYRAGLEYALRTARHLSVSGADAAAPPPHPAVSAALRVLREQPGIANAAALAAQCGVSQDYLRELLVEQTGRRFVEWRNRSRLERFQILYPESGDLLTAALDAGFGSYTQFHRVFSEIVGVTPGEWVKGPENGAAPPVVDFSPVPERASSRMIWYPLAGVVIPEAGRWFDAHFVEALFVVSETEGLPVATGIDASHDLRRFEPQLVASVAERDQEGARLLEEAYRRMDIIRDAATSMSQWRYDLSDFAGLVAANLTFAWTAVRGTQTPDYKMMNNVRARARRALAVSDRFAEAELEDLQRAAAALCTQGAIGRSAFAAARSSGRSDLLAQTRESIRRTAAATYGFDLAGARASALIAGAGKVQPNGLKE